MPLSNSEDSLPSDFYHFLRLENPEMDLEINMTTEQEVPTPPANSNPEDPDFQAQVDFAIQAPAPPPPPAPTHSYALQDIDTASGSRTRTYASLAPRAIASRSVRGRAPDRAPNLFITPAAIPPPAQLPNVPDDLPIQPIGNLPFRRLTFPDYPPYSPMSSTPIPMAMPTTIQGVLETRYEANSRAAEEWVAANQDEIIPTREQQIAMANEEAERLGVQPASLTSSETDSQPTPPGPINFYDRKHPGFVSDIIPQTVGQIKPFEYESPTKITSHGPIILQDCFLPENITGDVLSHLNVLKTQLDKLQRQLGTLPHNLVKKIDDDVDQIQATLKTLRRQTFSTFEDHYMVKTYNNCPSYLPTSPVEDQDYRIA